MGETSNLLGRALDRCQVLVVEGFKEGQRIQESITRLEDGICAVRELGSPVLPTALQRSCARDPAAASDVGSRCTRRKLEVQDLIYGLQKFEIGQNDGAGHALTTVDLNHRRECHIVAAGDGETRRAGSGRASTNPGRPSQKDPLTPFQRASRCSKTRGNSRRQRDRDDNDRPPQRRSKARLNKSIVRLPFACPYYYYNKEEHQNCLNYELNRIVDVRQHIYRFHVQPSHCPRCGIEFQDDPIYAQRDAHVNQQICELISGVLQYSGATSDQLGSSTTS
ncbi:hypothetical protein HD806DRAFT_518704 [Xylariaceae sp. AK1471]|nr:hypothetical protein HD806DRAFT_518704 [Xylariaceae sp. AK1471]